MKPTVHFLRDSIVISSGRISVACLDHPRLGCARIITSELVEMFDDGSFETLNSFYVPVDEEHMDDYIKE
jgi:hypothetical protein